MIQNKRIKITCVPSLSEFSKANLSEKGVADAFTVNASSYGKEISNNSQNYGAPRVTKEGTICASKHAVDRLNSSEVICKVLIGHILGISKAHPEYRSQVRNFLMSIRRFVPGQLILDCDFNYKASRLGGIDKTASEISEYFMTRYVDIENEYVANKSKMELTRALELKTIAIINLEEEKLSTDVNDNPLYGTPLNYEDYLTYLYCLNHSKIVKDLDALDIAHQARFSMISEEAIQLQASNQEKTKNLAIERYYDVISDKSKLYTICSLYNLDLSIEESTLKSSLFDKVLADYALFVRTTTNDLLKHESYLSLLLKYNVVTYNNLTDTYFDAKNASFVLGTGKKEVFQFIASRTEKSDGFRTRANIILKAKLKDEVFKYMFPGDTVAPSTTVVDKTKSGGETASNSK